MTSEASEHGPKGHRTDDRARLMELVRAKLVGNTMPSKSDCYDAACAVIEDLLWQLREREWIKCSERMPQCSKKQDDFGVEVLIFPQNLGSPGSPIGATAFFGRRVTREPNFYKYGAVIHGVTHWMPLPAPPNDSAPDKEVPR